MSTSQATPHAPGELEFVRGFVNSLDIEAGVDRFRDAAAWAEWVVWAGSAEQTEQAGQTGQVDEADLAFARDLREALRAGLLANHDAHGPAALPARTAALLTEAARRAGTEVRFGDSGLRLASGSAGAQAVLGRVVAVVAAATADGTWARLKACRNDTCQWAFYDRSRSRTGQWCSMAICGNRAKQARWREQRQA